MAITDICIRGLTAQKPNCPSACITTCISLWQVRSDVIYQFKSRIYISHDADSGFGKELELLKNHNYKFSTTPNADGFWYAYK